MHSFFSKNIYLPLSQSIKRTKVVRHLADLNETQYYPLYRLKQLQWEYLMALLWHCYRYVPWYKGIFKQIAITPRDIGNYDDFRNLPVLTKKDLFDHTDSFLAKSKGIRYKWGRTSGSTGIPLKFAITPLHSGRNTAHQWRGRSWWGICMGDREIAVWGRPFDSRKEEALTPIKKFLQNKFQISGFWISEKDLTVAVKKIIKLRPKILYGYAQSIFHLAKFILDQGLEQEIHQASIKLVELTAEAFTNFHREIIEKAFGCQTASHYGCSETGGFAFKCPSRCLHVSIENVLVEFLNPTTLEPVQDGRKAAIVVTPLHNYAMPLISLKFSSIVL